MKNLSRIPAVLLFISALILMSSCKKDPVNVPFTFSDKQACLAADPNQNYQSFPFDINHADVVSALNAAGFTDVSKVNTFKLQSMKAVIVTPGITFSELSTVEVYLKVAGTSGDGDQIAYAGNFGSSAVETVLSINGTEMKQLLTQDMVLTLKVLNKAAGGTGVIRLKLTEGNAVMEVKK